MEQIELTLNIVCYNGMVYTGGKSMDNELIKNNNDDVEYLKLELQQQRGMLWLFGEIMKAAINITSFKQLMSVLTDMLMGVMGVTTCYLWIKRDKSEIEDFKVYYRSIALKNEFREIKHMPLPVCVKNLQESYTFNEEEIKGSLLESIGVPSSRLAVPLKNFNDNSMLGALVVEHEEKNFFTTNTVAFFETLAIFISTNAQNSRLLQSVSEESITDPLTGTFNRRHLEPMLTELSNNHKEMTVAIVDTDNFKSINDVLGHMEGDVVLKAIAQLAKGCVKEHGGEVIRYGGDEFVILIPRPLEDAIHILEEFRKDVYYIRISYELATPISVTLGVCAYPKMVSNPAEAIKAADNALIRGKVKGKNRVVMANDADIEMSKPLR